MEAMCRRLEPDDDPAGLADNAARRKRELVDERCQRMSQRWRRVTSPCRQQAPQVDDHLPVDVFAVRWLEHLGRRADGRLELAVVVLAHRSHGLEQRPHLTPVDVGARGWAKILLRKLDREGETPQNRSRRNAAPFKFAPEGLRQARSVGSRP